MRKIIGGALALVAAGAIGAGGALAYSDHAEQQRLADFRGSCVAEGGIAHDMRPDQIVSATHDGGQVIAVRSSSPIRLCFEPTDTAVTRQR